MFEEWGEHTIDGYAHYQSKCLYGRWIILIVNFNRFGVRWYIGRTDRALNHEHGKAETVEAAKKTAMEKVNVAEDTRKKLYRIKSDSPRSDGKSAGNLPRVDRANSSGAKSDKVEANKTRRLRDSNRSNKRALVNSKRTKSVGSAQIDLL